MLCKLLGCSTEATSRAIHVFGTSNLCTDHAVGLAEEMASRNPLASRHVINELMFAHRYGPADDPPLEQPERGADYAHPRNGSE